MVQCVTAWTIEGAAKGVALVGGGATGGVGLALLSGQAWTTPAGSSFGTERHRM